MDEYNHPKYNFMCQDMHPLHTLEFTMTFVYIPSHQESNYIYFHNLSVLDIVIIARLSRGRLSYLETKKLYLALRRDVIHKKIRFLTQRRKEYFFIASFICLWSTLCPLQLLFFRGMMNFYNLQIQSNHETQKNACFISSNKCSFRLCLLG